MKRIGFMSVDYPPYGTATTNCIQPLINEMKSDHEVFVITSKRKKSELDFEIIDNVKIFRLPNYAFLDFEKSNNAIGVKRVIRKILLRVKYLWKFEGIESGIVRASNVKNLEDIINENKIDCLISISSPATNHLLINKIKKRKFIWCIYEFDPLGYHEHAKNGYPRFLNKHLEKKFFNNCDKVFLTNEIYNEDMNNDLSEFKEKMFPINFGHVEEGMHDYREEKEICDLLFLGNLNEYVRSPDYALEVLEKTDSIKFDIYTNFEGASIQKASKYDHIRISKFIPHVEALKLMNNSKVLVSIGNNVVNQMPSKIFEYICTGKPIIHFVKRKDDPTIVYLMKYPMSLIIDERDLSTEEARVKIMQFYEEYSGKTISFDEIKRIFKENTPKNVTKVILDIIKEDI